MFWITFFCGFVVYLFWVGRSGASSSAARSTEKPEDREQRMAGLFDGTIDFQDEQKPICSDLDLSVERRLLD